MKYMNKVIYVKFIFLLLFRVDIFVKIRSDKSLIV